MGPYCTGPPGPSLLATSGCHHWRPVQTCSLQNPLPRQYRHLVATEARTIGKWVVRIPLCFLVSTVKSRGTISFIFCMGAMSPTPSTDCYSKYWNIFSIITSAKFFHKEEIAEGPRLLLDNHPHRVPGLLFYTRVYCTEQICLLWNHKEN